MADISQYQAIEFAFARLLTELSKAWSMQDVAYVRDIVKHAEYGEALENLIAIGLRNGAGFSAGQRREVSAIGAMMKLDADALFTSLRAAGDGRHTIAAA